MQLAFSREIFESTDIFRKRVHNTQDAAFSCSPAELGKGTEERVATTPFHIFKLYKTAG